MAYRRRTYRKKRMYRKKKTIYKRKRTFRKSAYREQGKAVECNVYYQVTKNSTTFEDYPSRVRVYWGTTISD